MLNPDTYQLCIRLHENNPMFREDFKNWLIGMGEEAFVEGALDDLFEDPSYEVGADVQFEALGGDESPIFIYKYDRSHLQDLQSRILEKFPQQLACELSSISTDSWKEGWKESFKPIETKMFYIYPPWLSQSLDQLAEQIIPIEIEPGMAFGTGQHATTVLCLQAIEKHGLQPSQDACFLDVGTGTGILAIAGSKVGFARVIGTDIDPDSMIAAQQNAVANQVELELIEGSVPQLEQPVQFLIANIMFFVLKQIIGELSAQLAVGGTLVLSGLLSEESDDMAAIAAPYGLQLIDVQHLNDWACQTYRKI